MQVKYYYYYACNVTLLFRIIIITYYYYYYYYPPLLLIIMLCMCFAGCQIISAAEGAMKEELEQKKKAAPARIKHSSESFKRTS